MCQLQGIYNDYKATFFSGDIDVPNENSISFPFGVIQVNIHLIHEYTLIISNSTLYNIFS
jgi:hypothetical protein